MFRELLSCPLRQKTGGRGGFDAIVALGAVIRGETPHFDYVAGEAARGLQQVGAGNAACRSIFGVLTTDNWEQAEARAGGRRATRVSTPR